MISVSVKQSLLLITCLCVPALTLSTGCDSPDSTVIEQPADAQAQMEEYGNLQDEQNAAYGE